MQASPMLRRGFFLRAGRHAGSDGCRLPVAFMSESRRRILGPEQLSRAMRRIAHEIVERNGGAERLALVGIHTRGVPFARRIGELIASIEGTQPDLGTVDIALYRDDAGRHGSPARLLPTDISFDIGDRVVVLLDDVLYTGRTIRAALDALVDFGRPASVQLGVIVDRGHRELPIRADYVGKNVPTSRTERVIVSLEEIDGEDGVFVEEEDDANGS
jgi:pyrimidine operon attenuation protein/uracil phosphoribosyltransferase